MALTIAFSKKAKSNWSDKVTAEVKQLQADQPVRTPGGLLARVYQTNSRDSSVVLLEGPKAGLVIWFTNNELTSVDPAEAAEWTRTEALFSKEAAKILRDLVSDKQIEVDTREHMNRILEYLKKTNT